jgi:hypothetical protein
MLAFVGRHCDLCSVSIVSIQTLRAAKDDQWFSRYYINVSLCTYVRDQQLKTDFALQYQNISISGVKVLVLIVLVIVVVAFIGAVVVTVAVAVVLWWWW